MDIHYDLLRVGNVFLLFLQHFGRFFHPKLTRRRSFCCYSSCSSSPARFCFCSCFSTKIPGGCSNSHVPSGWVFTVAAAKFQAKVDAAQLKPCGCNVHPDTLPICPKAFCSLQPRPNAVPKQRSLQVGVEKCLVDAPSFSKYCGWYSSRG